MTKTAIHSLSVTSFMEIQGLITLMDTPDCRDSNTCVASQDFFPVNKTFILHWQLSL